MGFNGDYSLWEDFRKTVKKLDRSNLLVPELPQKTTKTVAHEVDCVMEVLSARVPRMHLNVKSLSRAEIKKFIPSRMIDLHGYTRQIDGALATFCAQCILDGIRDVLVITGKGHGIVKSATELWLNSHPEFIIGFFSIKDTMGESGSFGVRLRRK